MRITFKAFDSKMASREKLFKAAVDFANKLEPKQLITLTHSEDRDNIVITIWYWTDDVDKGAELKAQRDADVAKLYGQRGHVESATVGLDPLEKAPGHSSTLPADPLEHTPGRKPERSVEQTQPRERITNPDAKTID